MRRLGKRLLKLAGVLVALILVLVLAAPLLLSGDQVREAAVKGLEEATGAEVSLGKASVRVLPRLAVRLGDGRIAGTGAQLRARYGDDYGLQTYLAEIEAVEVRVGLLPLLKRQVQVDEIRLAGPLLRIVREGQETLAEDWEVTVRHVLMGVPDAPLPAGEAVPPGLLIPADLSCLAEARVQRLTVQEALYDAVRVEAELDARVLELPVITAGRSGGAVNGEATIDYDLDPWGELVFAYRAEDVPASALLAPFAADLAARLEGALGAEGSGTCIIKDQETVLQTLSLTGEAGMGEGLLRAGDWLAGAAPYLGERQDLKDVRFADLQHAYRIENGRYLVEELVIDGRDTAWRGDGWVGLDGTLDLNLQVKLPAGFTPDLGQWSFLADTLRDEDGRVQLDLRLSGRSARPNVGVDLTRLKAGAAENGAETLREGLGGLLDKWKTK